MKKTFLFLLLACGFIAFAISCSNKISPMAPSSKSAMVKANDVAATDTPGPQSVTISSGSGSGEHLVTNGCNNNSTCAFLGDGYGFTTLSYTSVQYPGPPCAPILINYFITNCSGGSVINYNPGPDNFSRSFTIPSDSTNLSLNWGAQAANGSITITINGVQVQNNCGGSYDFNNPPTTGCLAGVVLNKGGNNFAVSAYYGSTGYPGVTYSLVYNYVGSFLTPTPTFTLSPSPTFTPTGTLTPPTNTPSPTNTFTPSSSTPTNTFTQVTTATNTPTPSTPTQTNTFTPTVSPTFTPTGTITPPTSTPTSTPVPPTPTFTPVPPTATFTLVPTNTFSPTPTPSLPTATFTPTFTPSPIFTPTPNETDCAECDKVFREKRKEILQDTEDEIATGYELCQNTCLGNIRCLEICDGADEGTLLIKQSVQLEIAVLEHVDCLKNHNCP